MGKPTFFIGLNMQQPKDQTQCSGFTLIEVAVALVVAGLIIISLSNIFIAISVVQRQSDHLALATRSAEQEIESLRNSHYNTLVDSPPPIDFTSQLPTALATPRSASVNVSEPSAGIKRLDVTITWQEGSRSKTIELSSLLGNIGIAQ